MARAVEINGSLQGLQKVVDGYIEPCYSFEEQVCIICNEEGKLNGIPLNRAVYVQGEGEQGGREMVDIIAGPCFICDCSGENFGSLSPKQMKEYMDIFRFPERFASLNGEVIAIAGPEGAGEVMKDDPMSQYSYARHWFRKQRIGLRNSETSGAQPLRPLCKKGQRMMRKQNSCVEIYFKRSEREALTKKVRKSGLSREGYCRRVLNDSEVREAPSTDILLLIRELRHIGISLDEILKPRSMTNQSELRKTVADI